MRNQTIVTHEYSQCVCVYLKFSMFVYILSSLPVQDELCLVGNTHDMILHGVAQKSGKGVRTMRKWQSQTFILNSSTTTLALFTAEFYSANTGKQHIYESFILSISINLFLMQFN